MGQRARAFRTMLTLVVLSIGCGPSAVTHPATPSVVAETSISCFGYTARLALTADDATYSPSYPTIIEGIRWLLEVDGPPTVTTTSSVRASVEAFTLSRDGARALPLAEGDIRALGLLTWSGSTDKTSQTGLVRLLAFPEGFQAGDMGRLHMVVQTPSGTFWLSDVLFTLHLLSDRVEARDARVVSDPAEMPDGSCSS